MTRHDILSALGEYFAIGELVCEHILDRWGKQSWQFLSTDYLHALLIIRRDILQTPMTCNTGTSYNQRGMRCNRCQLVKTKGKAYLSSHVLGKAGDFTVSGMTAEQARQKIIAHADLLPCPIRLEGGVTWLHIDTLPQYGITDKVYVFKG